LAERAPDGPASDRPGPRAPNDSWPRVLPFGDAALLAMLGDEVDRELNAAVHALCALVDGRRRSDAAWRGVGAPVPAYASALVPFEPEATDAAWLAAELELLARVAMRPDGTSSRGLAAPARLIEVPVRYGGPDGPDLADVAARLGITEAQVVRAHAAPTYTAFMLGFAPGFAYLGPLPEALALPRRPDPRLRVPAGSVAIAGRQTAVYPFATPGGWHLLGRTDAPLWDVTAQPPALVRPGDTVRFRPVAGPGVDA
jgi:KipI family sensor histidine kinase inhibitor